MPKKGYKQTLAHKQNISLSLKKVDMSTRFWEKVQKDDGCWLWMGCRQADGYGRINSGGRRGKLLLAHRVSWELTYGPIPEDMCVLHKCDNPPCVNPNHLFMGTYKDNTLDMKHKGRGNHPVGEESGRAKLNEKQVLEIKQALTTGKRLIELAKEYRVSDSTISDIKAGKTWRIFQG